MNRNLTPGIHVHCDGPSGYGWHQRKDATLEVGEVSIDWHGGIRFKPLVRVKMPVLRDDDHAWEMVRRYLKEVWPGVRASINGAGRDGQ